MIISKYVEGYSSVKYCPFVVMRFMIIKLMAHLFVMIGKEFYIVERE